VFNTNYLVTRRPGRRPSLVSQLIAQGLIFAEISPNEIEWINNKADWIGARLKAIMPNYATGEARWLAGTSYPAVTLTLLENDLIGLAESIQPPTERNSIDFQDITQGLAAVRTSAYMGITVRPLFYLGLGTALLNAAQVSTLHCLRFIVSSLVNATQQGDNALIFSCAQQLLEFSSSVETLGIKNTGLSLGISLVLLLAYKLISPSFIEKQYKAVVDSYFRTWDLPGYDWHSKDSSCL